MERFFIIHFFLFLNIILFGQKVDTIIEIQGNTIFGLSKNLVNDKFTIAAGDNQVSFGLMDTNLNLIYFNSMSNDNWEFGISIEEKIYATNLKNRRIYSRYISQNFVPHTINKFTIPIFDYKIYSNKIIFSPDFNSRDTLQNLYIQRLNFNDSIVKYFIINNSQNYGYCHLGNETTNGLIPYLLTAKDSGGYYEFGYFDSVFNRLDSFRFKHPDIQPNKGLNKFSAWEIFVKNDLLYVAGCNQIKGTNTAPYKFTIDLKTKKIISTWQNAPKNLNSNFFVFRVNKYYFDKWGNLFFVGRADTKKDESWNNWHGFVQMVDTNNNLLVDTLYKFNPATNNETDFIYHLGGGRVILGGHYNYNTGITPAAWYKKFNIKDWYSPTVSIQEKTNQENKFLVYPNPTNSTIKIEGQINEIKEIKLTDIHGKVLIEKSVFNQVDISKFPNGVYFLTIKLENGNTETHKIIK